MKLRVLQMVFFNKMAVSWLSQVVVFTLLTWCSQGLAQPMPKVEATDSLFIDLSASVFGQAKPGYAKIVKKGNQVFFLTSDTRLLYILDLLSGKISEVFPSADSTKPYRIVNFDLSDERIFTVDLRMDFISEHDYQGKLLGRIRLNRMFTKTRLSGYESFAYHAKRNSFMLKVQTGSPEAELLSHPHKVKSYFERNDLIAEVDRKGKRLATFGAFDLLYQQRPYFHGDYYSFVVDRTGRVLLHQELSDEVQLHEAPFEKAETLTFRGKFLTVKSAQLPATQKPYTAIEDFYSHAITSYQYTFMELLNGNGLLYRVYRDGGVDSTLGISFPPRDQPSDDKMCLAPSPRKLAQMDLLRQKPSYVQIIDYQAGQLLYDGIFVFDGDYLLPSKDDNPGVFYSYSWTGAQFKLYSYEVGVLKNNARISGH